MMAFLLKQTKEVLLEVAIDLGVEVNSTLTKPEIKNIICQSEEYNEESVKSLLEGILAVKWETKESERETREYEERKLIGVFELERMKLSNSMGTISVSLTDLEGQGVNRRVNLRDLVPKFDAKNADINLFFEIFERQARKEKERKENEKKKKESSKRRGMVVLGSGEENTRVFCSVMLTRNSKRE
ncbi:hypothetical protein TNCV_2324731 [Trichonephila clavipes]|nr:hypothetical protein TNCV_2324731 [Trichonephila clavipes]